MAIEFNIENNNLEKKSFALLRTNPKLTSNIKLVVDSAGELFLSAFKANKALSKVKYQKFGIKKNGSFSNDVARFFKGIPTNEKFETLRKHSDISPFSDYSFQYEEQYNYGASFNSTKLYDEQYKILAPIWLDRQIPKNFVIYRVSEVDYNNNYNNEVQFQNDRILELLKSAKIIKTFDLTKSSNLGTYLNSHVFDKGVQPSPINFNFGESATVEFKGIDTKKGGFVNKREFLADDYIRKDNPEIYANEIISQGFERHDIISSNLINLEFLFDDTSAENYKIYRYFGLYVDPIEEGKFNIDTISNSGVISIEPNSVKSAYNLEGTTLSDSHMLPSMEDLQLPILSYINLGDNQYTNIKNDINFSELRLPTSISKNEYVVDGLKKLNNNIQTIDSKISNKGFLKLNIVGIPNLNDRVYLGDKTEIELAEYSLFDFTCIADDQLNPGKVFGNKFSKNGGFNQIAIALGAALQKFNSAYKVTVEGPSIIIEDYAAGDSRKRMSFGIYSQNLNNFIEVESGLESDCGLLNAVVPPYQGTDFSEWQLFTATGGSKKGAVYLTKASDLKDVKVGYFAKELKLNKYSEIISIVKDIYDTDLYRIIFNKPIKLSNDGVIQLYEKFKPSFGKFSAYDLKDFDFDFYSTSNSDLKELKYEEELDYEEEFNSLTPILKQEDVEENIELDKIYSEYERLSENKLKEFALKSRIVPTIMKFALKNGTNARNLPYYLNANESFGIDNLSPNIELESGINADNLNMEHFHFNQMPEHIYYTPMKELTSYTDFKGDGGISYDELVSTKIDYFNLYFKRSGSFNTKSSTWLDDNSKDLFTKFENAGGESNASTVFRGLRYIYKKRKEDSKKSPTEFIQTPEANDFKFAVILNYNTGKESNSVEYKVIKNDVFKFICIVVDINIVENDITTLSRSSVYNSVDIELNGASVNTVIPFDIDLGMSNWSSEIGESIVHASQFATIDGSADFLSNITKNSEGNYSWIYFDLPNNTGTYGMKVSSVIDDSTIKVFGKPILFDPITGPFVGSPELSESVMDALPTDTVFHYWRTGESGWTNILNQIVSYNFASRFNKFGNIKYLTITETEEIENDFILQVEDGVQFVKPSVLQTSPDGDKPKAYQLVSNEIGRIISARNDGGYLTILRRFNGDYTPVFKDCVNFTDINNDQSLLIPEVGSTTVDPVDERSFLIHNKFKHTGISFASFKNTNEDYGFIKNMFYHKVNDENSKNLLKLSETSDKLPLYPVIGEIAIDKKDFNVFNSKYADDYFTKSLPGRAFENTFGTLSPVELKSFMVSTIMKVKDTYDLTSFASNEETSIDSLDYIRFNKLNTKSIHWFEEEDTITADFYLPKSIFNELLEDGILNKFKNYVNSEESFGDKSTVEDDLEIYVYKNIVTRFIVDSISIYGIEAKNIETDFVSVDSPEDIESGGYTQLTNFETRGYQNDGLSFRLIYNKRKGYKYNLKFHIKIQA